MSAKKSKRTKAVVPVPQKEQNQMGSDLSGSVNRTSFMEGLQQNCGNPLHSTALDEDLDVPVDKKNAGSMAVPKTQKTAGQQLKAAERRTGTEEEEEEPISRRSSKRVRDRSRSAERRTAGERDKKSGRSCGPQKNSQPAPTSSRSLAGGTLSRRGRSTRQVTAASGHLKDKKTETESAESEKETDSGAVQQRRRKVLSSDEGTDEDTSWNPSSEKVKKLSFGPAAQNRKSLSKESKSKKSPSVKRNDKDDEDVSSGTDETSSSDRRRRKRPVGRGGSHFDVILDAFLDFCDQYRESVESAAVNQSVRRFSRNVQEQLLEKISSLKELQTLKRENTKVASSIRTKTQRLVDAKSELMRAERQVWLLQKEEAELQQRLADIKQGQSFLHSIRELSGHYLGHRRKHRTQKETYGASSLPALLMETKLLQTAAERKQLTQKQSRDKGTRK